MSPRKNDPGGDGLPDLETFREVMRLKGPSGDIQTLIVTRKGTGRGAAVWLSLSGTASTTVVLTGGQEDKVVDMLKRAKAARYVRSPSEG